MSAARPAETGRSWREVLALPLIWMVRAYQLLVSPLLGPTCKFYPSCSAYAVDALRVHGPLTGLWLSARRLVRCHPWSHGGVDHVPPRRTETTTTGEHRSPRD